MQTRPSEAVSSNSPTHCGAVFNHEPLASKMSGINSPDSIPTSGGGAAVPSYSSRGSVNIDSANTDIVVQLPVDPTDAKLDSPGCSSLGSVSTDIVIQLPNV